MMVSGNGDLSRMIEPGVWLAVKVTAGGPQTKVWVLLKNLPAYLAAEKARNELVVENVRQTD